MNFTEHELNILRLSGWDVSSGRLSAYQIGVRIAKKQADLFEVETEKTDEFGLYWSYEDEAKTIDGAIEISRHL